MKLIDSHAHLDFEDFHPDFDAVLKRAAENGVEKIVNIGADLERSRASVMLAENYSNIWATVGVHPDEAANINLEEVKLELERLIKSSRRVIAVGECGLDYYRTSDKSEIAAQNALFKAQLEIAREHHLPVVIHIRTGENDQAIKDAVGIIKEVEYFNGVVHCFTFGPNEAKSFTDLGFHLGFTGIVTYKNAIDIQEAAKETDLDKILIETDCPFLAPQKYRGQRNEPSYVIEVAEKIAELRGLTAEEIATKAAENTEKLFKI
jgi:TatD DNase family protein